MKTKYINQNYWTKSYLETDCIILSEKEKTARIKLLQFAANGTPPNSIINVHKKSLLCYRIKPVTEKIPIGYRLPYID